MNRFYYAAHNIRADLESGNRGFANTWEVSRFPRMADRDAFVDENENRRARSVTRKEAVEIFRNSFLSVGKPVPAGGLFGSATRYGPPSNFWNERAQ